MVLAATLALLCGLGAQSPEGVRQVDPPALDGALAPNLASCGETVVLSWLEPVATPGQAAEARGRRYRLRLASWRDGSWTTPSTIVQSDSMFANWADVPSAFCAPDGTLIAHWLRKSGEGTYAYDVVLTRSGDNGESWVEI
ncbi:MAG: hypothetical protein ACYTGC_03915, partial [Planctomycetota bacterium]